ncbi:MAG TPA: RNA pseudouridine synthase [Opitutaceae bacterium]|nr:RNA pseudouridine synthase [Opitutaceae bacterium]
MSAPPESFWAALPFGRGVTLLAHDGNGVAALNKPAGVLSHPNERGEEARALLAAPYVFEGEFFEWAPAGGREPQRLWLLNRLDSATSGVILAAADPKLAAEIRAQFKRKVVRKVYSALVFGAPRQPQEVWRDRLSVEKRAGQIRTAARAGHVPAESRMIVVRTSRGEPRLTLVRLEPRTGRSHQLRVQCAKRNLPIVGDQTYGDFRRNREFAKSAGTKRLFLHSMETAFEYEFGGRKYSFTAAAPLPPEFEKVV